MRKMWRIGVGLQGIGVGMREWGWECGNLAGYAGNVKNGVGMRGIRLEMPGIW